MPLSSQPLDAFIQSPESNDLARLIAPKLKSLLKLQRFSTVQYQYHLSKTLLNLYLAWSSNKDKCVGISRRKNYYDTDQGIYQNKKLSYTYMINCLNGLERLNYLELVKGGWIDYEQGTSETSRYRALKPLTDLFIENGFNQQSIFKDPDALTIRLRGKKPRKTQKNKNPRGKLISYNASKETRRMTKHLKTINEVLKNTDINLYVSNREMTALNKQMANKNEEDPSHLPEIQFSRKWLYRVFNESFDQGGRFYGGYWQEIPSKYRSRITIDHCMTFEIDFDSLHPAILYLKEGSKKEDYLDPYQLTNSIGSKSFDSVKGPRNAIKISMNIMFNSKSYQEALSAIQKSDIKLPKDYKSFKDLIRDIEQYHSPIAHYFYKGMGLELQRMDSNIVEKVLIELIKENTIALPVHDSFICKAGDLGLLIEKMNKATKHYLGSELFISIDPPKLDRPLKALTINNSKYYSRRFNYLKRFNKEEDPTEPYIL